MAKQTREKIIQASIPIFNQKGYAGATLSDIMAATGLHKGSIYACFEDKQAIAVAVFRQSVAEVDFKMETAIRQAGGDAADQLLAMMNVYESLVDDPNGGCPILNTAIDSDDAYLFLKIEAQAALSRWQERIKTVLQAGNLPDDLANIIIASLEGGLMLSKLIGDKQPIQQMISYVMERIKQA